MDAFHALVSLSSTYDEEDGEEKASSCFLSSTYDEEDGGDDRFLSSHGEDLEGSGKNTSWKSLEEAFDRAKKINSFIALSSLEGFEIKSGKEKEKQTVVEGSSMSAKEKEKKTVVEGSSMSAKEKEKKTVVEGSSMSPKEKEKKTGVEGSNKAGAHAHDVEKKILGSGGFDNGRKTIVGTVCGVLCKPMYNWSPATILTVSDETVEVMFQNPKLRQRPFRVPKENLMKLRPFESNCERNFDVADVGRMVEVYTHNGSIIAQLKSVSPSTGTVKVIYLSNQKEAQYGTARVKLFDNSYSEADHEFIVGHDYEALYFPDYIYKPAKIRCVIAEQVRLVYHDPELKAESFTVQKKYVRSMQPFGLMLQRSYKEQDMGARVEVKTEFDVWLGKLVDWDQSRDLAMVRFSWMDIVCSFSSYRVRICT